jgi:hypothetical protein
VVIGGSLRELTAVRLPLVVNVLSVLLLNLVRPDAADEH